MAVKKYPDINFVYSLIFIVTCWSLNYRFSTGMAQPQRNESTVVVKVGAVIDVSGTVGKIGMSCINISLSDFYLSHSHYKTRIQLIVRDSHRDVVSAAAQGTFTFPHLFLSLVRTRVFFNGSNCTY